ncbi:putative membrane protein [Burkholderia pseudomallei MSHR3964]|nr:putative membrane protein [Burkholderia pseudomallei MSHR3964]
MSGKKPSFVNVPSIGVAAMAGAAVATKLFMVGSQ